MAATKTQNKPAPKQRNLPLPDPERPDPTLGQKIRELIERRNLKLKEASEMVRMSKQQLFRIMNVTENEGVPNPGYLTVQKIVRRLGFQMKDLCDDGDLADARTGEKP